MTQLSQSTILECKKRLLTMKEELLNRAKGQTFEISAQEKAVGDEIDQVMAQQQENDFVRTQQRVRSLIMEIDFALGRIRSGTFGVCEETEEFIETERLLAIPYTRLSIEGAEIREAMKTKYAW